jgi:hypothetical protein
MSKSTNEQTPNNSFYWRFTEYFASYRPSRIAGDRLSLRGVNTNGLTDLRLIRSKKQFATLVLGCGLLIAGANAATTHITDRRDTPHVWCSDRCDQVVVDWSSTAYQVIKAANDYQDPMAASRTLAMMHLAMHDAVNAVKPRYAPYATTTRDAGADPAIAAVTAAHDVLLQLYPSQKALLKAALDVSMQEAGIGQDVVKGNALGKIAASNILARRANDNSNGQETYRGSTAPGQYRFTPGFDFIAAPHWRTVRPFALTGPSQFRVAPPPALDSVEYTKAFNEVQQVGINGSSAKRTPDESQYAAFWYEFSEIGWNRLARSVAREHRQDLWDRARTFALLNVAMADAYIAGWDSKMHYNFWRPVTAIRLAANDRNSNTVPDATWTPFRPTPPIQDHPSTHSALGAAAAAVLAHSFGRDQIKFSFASMSADPANPAREFSSFSEAARENADSRVKAGLHFRFATEEGLKLGENIGRFTTAHLLNRIR